MKKIGFLFLCKNKINQLSIWKQFFKNNYDRCNIYIHCYDRTNITQDFVKQYLTPEKKLSRWGLLLIVIKYLFSLSIQDNNYKHILVSESCIPLKSFDYIYNLMISNEKSYLYYQPHLANNNNEKKTLIMQYQRYIYNMQRIPEFSKMIDIKHWYFNSGWFIFNTKHAQLLFKDTKYYKLFNKCFVGDENYPSFILSIHNELNNVVNTPTTHVNWKEKTVVKNQHHPKLYNKITTRYYTMFCNKQFLFGRKFSETSDIHKFINNIWNSHSTCIFST